MSSTNESKAWMKLTNEDNSKYEEHDWPLLTDDDSITLETLQYTKYLNLTPRYISSSIWARVVRTYQSQF